MPLADDIRTLGDRALSDLNAAHDYYTDTKIAWDIVRQFIAAGNTFSVRNMTTGTITTQADLAGKSRGYVAEQLAEATFQQFIAIFENYFFDLLRLWLAAYPKSLSGESGLQGRPRCPRQGRDHIRRRQQRGKRGALRAACRLV